MLAEKGQRRVGSVTSGERGSNTTVICAMSGAGNFIPPMFIFARQRMTPLLEKDGPAGALYTNSKNGWINEELFVTWVKHFAAFVNSGQSQQSYFQGYKFYKENHITMISIPPHSFHRIQPLDVSFYGPLKTAYRHECNRHMKTHLMSKITPYDVEGLFNKAYVQVSNISKAESGFRDTGIYPLNSNVFTDQDFLAPSLMAQESEQNAENQEPNVQNFEDVQPDHMAIISGHTSPLAGPSNKNQCSESVLTVACNQELVDEQRTPVSFAAIATTPTIAPSSKSGHRKRKQHATILTATPMKTILEDKEKKRIAKLNKTGKDNKSRPKKVVKEKKNHMKQKSYKRKILQVLQREKMKSTFATTTVMTK